MLLRSTLVCLFFLGASAVAQDVTSLGRELISSPKPATRAALERIANSRSPQSAQASLALAAADLLAARYPTALQYAAQAKPLSRIADHLGYIEGTAHYELGDDGAALAAFARVLRSEPASPWLPQAVLGSARALIRQSKSADALKLLRNHATSLPPAQGDLLSAQASEAANDFLAASAYYQNVYYRFPDRPEAVEAEQALARLRSVLAGDYPPPTAQLLLARAFRLLSSGQYSNARRELEAVLPQIGGNDRDLARVRLGLAAFRARQDRAALDVLNGFRASDPEIEAERLFHVHAAARRQKLATESTQPVVELGARFPQSRWRLEALVSAANEAFLNKDDAAALKLYSECAQAFPREAQGANCHWKVVWNAYLRRDADSSQLLRKHVTGFPGSEKRAAALYFLGRLSEKQGELPVAAALYRETAASHPNFYHGMLARRRLDSAELRRIVADASTVAWLRANPPSARKLALNFEPDRASALRIERAKILAGSGLDGWAEAELRFGAEREGQPHVLALELAEVTAQAGAADRGLRYIKRFAPGYLSVPFEAAPLRFWQSAFPMPFREPLVKYAQSHGLDPFLVAALIRQESEFNPQAVSPARAYGLTQVLPSTGRELSRKLGIPRFTASHLFEPEINLRLGTYYLRQLLDQLNGNMEATLASYNGGKSRVLRWLSEADYQEPAEFVESIPFTETRNYVQIVLRNADIYRRLYGKQAAASQSTATRASE
jgi:soluble lytic murein transglycosylase